MQSHANSEVLHLQYFHLVLSCGGREERRGGQETEAVNSDSLIEGVTVVSPPRLSQPPCSAQGKYSNRHHRGESALLLPSFFGICMVEWKEFYALICVYRLWGLAGEITRESIS